VCGVLPILTGCSTLHLASAQGNLAGVQKHLQKGADVNARDFMNDLTPLQWATMDGALSQPGNLDVVQCLVAHGADVNARGGAIGNTPLIMASGAGNLGVVKCLIEHGADINATNKVGTSALMEATRWLKSTEVPEYLIEKGANVNQVSRDYGTSRMLTPLMKAAYAGKVEMVKLLLDRGADVEARDGNGTTALMLAASANWMNIAYDPKETSSARAIKEKATRSYLAILELLTEKGADVNARNMRGQTALMYATDENRKAFLIQHGATE